MKKIILIIGLSFFGSLVKAQDITSIVTGTIFNYQMISNTQHSFTFHTYFNLGYQSTCPSLINPTFSIIDNTLYVKGYYDVTGAWPTAFCDSFQTVTYNYQIPSNITQIITSTNVIASNNTPPYNPAIITYENLYFQTFNVNALSNVNYNNADTKMVVYPNPTQGSFSIINGYDFKEIKIINNIGQTVKSFEKNISDNYDIKDVQHGLYYLVFFNINSKKIGESIILKSN